MSSIRQNKVAALLQKELGQYFQKESMTICKGSMVSVTVVRMSPDLGLARVYLSIFGGGEVADVLKSIEVNTPKIRGAIGKNMRHQLRVIPNLKFLVDDSIDYADEIDQLLKK